jgi:hypothetical protein
MVKKYVDYLKQKATSLELECKNIRKMENKRLALAAKARAGGFSDAYHMAIYFGLNEHRVNFLRRINRAVTIALGFLNGYEYSDIERISYTQPDWEHIESLVREYGEGNANERMDRYGEWEKRALNGVTKLKNGGIRTASYAMKDKDHVYGLKPGSVKEVYEYINKDWVLRNHEGSLTAWETFWDSLHPKKEKKPYNPGVGHQKAYAEGEGA